jgi:hypothetical protein
MQRIVFATPGLLASYLEKLHRMQDAAEVAVRERAQAAGSPYAPDDPAPRAITGAAFGCLLAAQHAWLAGGANGTFADAIDRAMAAVGPAPEPSETMDQKTRPEDSPDNRPRNGTPGAAVPRGRRRSRVQLPGA